MKSNAKIFLSYSKKRLKTILLFCLFILIFICIFTLYQLPIEAVGYAFLLCCAIGFVTTLLDFVHFYRRHKLLKQMLYNINISVEELPHPKNLLERDYQTLLHELYDSKHEAEQHAELTRLDMVDYYTLWVHQIKTPIAAMRLLLQGEDTKHNSELSMELFKIEQYVEMVLQYLRIDSSSTDFVLKSYSLDEIVKHSVRKYAKLFVGKKIKLEFDTLDCKVLTDEKWLAFVVDQLLSNAVKYTLKGKISIYMEENSTLVIEDTGIGIAPEDLPRVFEKGFTGYNGRIDKKSTGIGLYLSKRTLTKLSHTITIESQIGRGTVVKVGLDSLTANYE